MESADFLVGRGGPQRRATMFQNLKIHECYRHAEQARQKAETATDSYTRNDFLDLERRWLSLAHSYEFSERLIYPSQRLTPAAHPRA